MKVCAVTTWPPHKDGVALYSAELYTHIAELVDVKVVANIPERTYTHEHYKVKEGIVLRCWKRGSFTYPLRIFLSALKERPNIIHLQHGWLLYGDFIRSTLFPILLFLFRLSHRPCVVTVHMVIQRNTHIFNNVLANWFARMVILFITKFIIKTSDKVIVHNCLMKKVLQGEYTLEEDKILVIPHGIKNVSDKPKVFQNDKKALTILSLGFVRKSKGIEDLIKAFEKFLEYHPDTTLVIAGGRHAHDKRDYIERFRHSITTNLSKRIFFTGFIDEISLDRLIWASDIVTLLSTEQYFIETSGALARVADYGKPIVCTRVPKFEGELRNGENSIMIRPCDSAELVKAFVLLTQNAQLRRNLGENLRKNFSNRCWSAVAKQHLMLYRSILKFSASST